MITNTLKFNKEVDKYYEDFSDAWKQSEYFWLRSLSSSKKGNVVEKVVADILRNDGFDVRKPKTRDVDIVVNNVPIEIKSSFIWNEGNFVFQQIRDYDYDVIIFVAIDYNNVDIWFTTKNAVFDSGTLRNQHAKSNKTQMFSTRTKPIFCEDYTKERLQVVLEILLTFRKNEDT